MLRCQCPSVRLSVTEVHCGHGACREEGRGSSRAMPATARPSCFDLGCILVNCFTTVGGPAKHCVDQYIVLFRYCLLRGDTAMPGGIHARLLHTFLVFSSNYSALLS